MADGGRTSCNRGTPTTPKEIPRGQTRHQVKGSGSLILLRSPQDNGETDQILSMNVHNNDKCSLRFNLDDNSKMDQVQEGVSLFLSQSETLIILPDPQSDSAIIIRTPLPFFNNFVGEPNPPFKVPFLFLQICSLYYSKFLKSMPFEIDFVFVQVVQLIYWS
ncbi:hypothetical protein RIF29_38919 [Crotalaria pallida]|uniref:Uncharacterized protein n=1 Tax=Crotalaria pallida TaxID=3830 RepID=A0AAN9E133_CROPI